MMLAFGYAVQPDKDKNEFESGWTKARDSEDALEKIMLRFTGVPREQIKVIGYGETWDSFISTEDRRPYGWD